MREIIAKVAADSFWSTERITSYLIALHWLPIKARVIYKICCLVKTTLLTGRPTYLRSQLVRTRNRLYVPRIKSDYGKRTFRYYAPSVYNKLPNHLRTTDSVASFKKNLKTHLFSLAYDMETLTINADFQL